MPSSPLRIRPGTGVAPSSYPAGVAGNATLEAVWDYKTAGPGNNAPRTWVTSVSGKPTSWVNLDTFVWGSPSGTWSLSDTYVDNGQLQTRGDGTITNVEFNNPGSGAGNSRGLGIGEYATPSSMVMSYSYFNGAGMVYYWDPPSGPFPAGRTGSAAILGGVAVSSSISISWTRINHAPLVCLKVLATTIAVTDCFIGTFGFDPKDDSIPTAADNSHMEQVFIGNGTTTFTRVNFDTSDDNTDPTNTLTTGIHYIEGDALGNIVVYYINCVIKGAQTQGSPSTKVQTAIALAAKNGTTVQVHFQGCAIEPGQGYYIQTQAETGGGVVTCYDDGGNKDLNTGAALSIGTKNTPV